MTKSDPRDWEVWQAAHDNWTKLVNTELEYQAGRASDGCRDLLKTIDKREGWALATPGSSASSLSTMEAFERGYQGGWAK